MRPLPVIIRLLILLPLLGWIATAMHLATAGGGGFPFELMLERVVPARGVHLELLRARDHAGHGRFLMGSTSLLVTATAGVVDFPVDGAANPSTIDLYFTRVKLGNPAKEFFVQINIGSDILWLTCNSCTGCPTSSGLNIPLEFFDLDKSSTSTRISCFDDRCSYAVQTEVLRYESWKKARTR
ncbi:aspartic proteinase-like protein 2 [Canna indica]|uniref:Aspartic proteinase-like protein 2 n=1 Tax=Canna indica TaxID=4628 RepID=A0AAQ3JZ95_9LILI|nr:aspartic proteinase-like protein 2 [Canna indica]